MSEKKGLIEELVDDATTNPDGPRESDRVPPQTTEAEPTSNDPPERPDGGR